MLTPPLANRFLHISYTPAFIRGRPALLDACPTNPTASGRAWPSRRTWIMTADVLALLSDEDSEAAYPPGDSGYCWRARRT